MNFILIEFQTEEKHSPNLILVVYLLVSVAGLPDVRKGEGKCLIKVTGGLPTSFGHSLKTLAYTTDASEMSEICGIGGAQLREGRQTTFLCFFMSTKSYILPLKFC